MIILGIDPGPEQSAYVLWDSAEEKILAYDLEKNNAIHEHYFVTLLDLLAIEVPCLRGNIVWQQVIDTAFEAGRFTMLHKKFIKVNPAHWRKHITGKVNAPDSQVKQCLMARFGEKGTKKAPGKLYGMKSHIWDALGIAVYAGDTYGT